MYETGPWQVSAGWIGTRNTNGNGSVSLANLAGNNQVAVFAAPTSTGAAFGSNTNFGALSFGQETADKFEVGANYALGPGIKVLGGVQYYNFAGPSNAVAAQSWAILLGMDLRF
jgi:predicted porin